MTSKRDVLDYFANSVEKKHKYYAWYLFQNSFLKASLNVVSYRNDRKQLVLKVDPESRHYFEQMISGNGKLNLCIPDQSVSFSADLISYSKDGVVELKFPKLFTVWDRRSSPRVDAWGAVDIELVINKAVIKKHCFDISLGGVSLVISKREVAQINKIESPEMEAKIKINGVLFNIKLNLVGRQKLAPYRYENAPYGAEKIALKFLEPDKKMIDIISSFITEYQKLDHNAS